MKISVDLDGTLYAQPQFSRELFHWMQRGGHEVGILTGHAAERNAEDVFDLETKFGIHPSFYLGRTLEWIPRNGSHFKVAMIRQHGIDIHFDDLDYGHPESTRIFEADPVARERLVRMPVDHARAKELGW